MILKYDQVFKINPVIVIWHWLNNYITLYICPGLATKLLGFVSWIGITFLVWLKNIKMPVQQFTAEKVLCSIFPGPKCLLLKFECGQLEWVLLVCIMISTIFIFDRSADGIR